MKKYFTAILLCLLLLPPISSHAAGASLILNLSAKEVLRGGEITLSGTVAKSDSEDEVVIKIVSPKQTVFYLDVLPVSDGSYSATVAIPGKEELAPFGDYTVVAGSGAAKEVKTFAVVRSISEEPGDGEETGGGGTTGPGTTPADDTGIPADAGQASGSNIEPELGKDGHYRIGSETFAQAIKQGDGAVTIQLPAAASESGSALVFPAEALKDLQTQKQDLIIMSGNVAIRFPAGSIAASSNEQSLVRIVLSAAMTDEVKQLIERSLQANAGYTSTGLVFSVSIEMVTGDKVVEIKQLDKPAEATLKLTKEQEKTLRLKLAGIYGVDGKAIRYVGGKMDQGSFTFMVQNLSYYTILEYDKTFVDMTGHWAEDAVKELAAKHIVTGVDDQHFKPDRTVTRAEFITMVMRAMEQAGHADIQNPTHSYVDVPANMYYAEHVAAASSLGIVTGYNGAFRPNDQITRQEAAAILVRAAEYFSFSKTTKGQLPFADAGEISAWALSPVSEAWEMGLIQGDGHRFNPHHSTTRAQSAVMIGRLLADRTS